MSNKIIKEEKKWYLIHTYSGYEKKVKTDLEKRIQTLELTDKVFRIIVPEEEVEEEKRGKKVIVARKLFPSYVMVEMLTTINETETDLTFKVDSRAWYVIRNTNGVTGFLGVGSDPIPMSDDEVKNIFEKIDINKKIKSLFSPGDKVVIKAKGLEGIEGVVDCLLNDDTEIKINVEMSNRITPFTVKIDEIEKI